MTEKPKQYKAFDKMSCYFFYKHAIMKNTGMIFCFTFLLSGLVPGQAFKGQVQFSKIPVP